MDIETIIATAQEPPLTSAEYAEYDDACLQDAFERQTILDHMAEREVMQEDEPCEYCYGVRE